MPPSFTITNWPRYTIAEATYGSPLVCFHSICVAVTSPDPPCRSANALFRDASMNFLSISDSSRVYLPSLFASLLSKKSFMLVLSDSSFDRTPSLSASPSLRKSSYVGILNSDFSDGSPGDQPAKNSWPWNVSGVVQHADGIPSTYHF